MKEKMRLLFWPRLGEAKPWQLRFAAATILVYIFTIGSVLSLMWMIVFTVGAIANACVEVVGDRAEEVRNAWRILRKGDWRVR